MTAANNFLSVALLKFLKNDFAPASVLIFADFTASSDALFSQRSARLLRLLAKLTASAPLKTSLV